MSFSQQSVSSFTPYRGPNSPDSFQAQFDFHQFSRLSLNSHGDDSSDKSESYRSNASLGYQNPSMGLLGQKQKRDFDLLSMRSRNKKSLVEIGIKPSLPGNRTFLNNSFVGKSQLYRHEDFNFVQSCQEPVLRKQLSEKSCPVRNEQLSLQQRMSQHIQYEHNADFGQMNQKSRPCKKFKKTKNYLRTLSSYLHKYIKFNKKARNFVIQYRLKQLESKQLEENNNQNTNTVQMSKSFYNRFLGWVNSLSMNNFQEYQRTWTGTSQFCSIYRQICYKYYIEEAFIDIQRSRLTSKQIIQEYLPQFIEGLFNPNQFTHFKNQ